ncbi:unnamed protein product [Closterium sp. NIES-53]
MGVPHPPIHAPANHATPILRAPPTTQTPSAQPQHTRIPPSAQPQHTGIPPSAHLDGHGGGAQPQLLDALDGAREVLFERRHFLLVLLRLLRHVLYARLQQLHLRLLRAHARVRLLAHHALLLREGFRQGERCGGWGKG